MLTGAYLTRNLAKTNFHVGPDNTTTAFCDAFKSELPPSHRLPVRLIFD